VKPPPAYRVYAGDQHIDRSTTMIVRSSFRRFTAGLFAAAVTLGGILIAHAHHLA
jgi:hypothetical protein